MKDSFTYLNFITGVNNFQNEITNLRLSYANFRFFNNCKWPFLVSIYWKFFRLYRLWMILYNLVSIGIFLKTGDIGLVFLLKLIGYPAIHLIVRPFSQRYDYYFYNLHYTPSRLFFIICLLDLTAFAVLIIPLSFFY